MRDGLLALETKYPSQAVLLVAHGFLAKTIRALAKGDFSDFYDWQLANGQLLALENLQIPVRDTDVLRASLLES